MCTKPCSTHILPSGRGHEFISLLRKRACRGEPKLRCTFIYTFKTIARLISTCRHPGLSCMYKPFSDASKFLLLSASSVNIRREEKPLLNGHRSALFTILSRTARLVALLLVVTSVSDANHFLCGVHATGSCNNCRLILATAAVQERRQARRSPPRR